MEYLEFRVPVDAAPIRDSLKANGKYMFFTMSFPVTTSIRMTQGSQALRSAAGACAIATGGTESLTRMMFAGFQTRRKPIRQTIETSAAPIAVSQGPCRFEISSF